MGQIPSEPLDLCVCRKGDIGAHDQHVVLPSHEGMDIRILREGKHNIRADGEEAVIAGGDGKPQGEDEEEDQQKSAGEDEKGFSVG